MDTERRFSALLAEADPEVAKKLTFVIESQTGANVYETRDPESAAEFAQSLSDLHLVVIGGQDRFKTLLTLLASPEWPQGARAVLMVDGKLTDRNLLLNPNLMGVINRARAGDELTKLLQEKFLEGTAEDGGNPGDFCRIKPPLILTGPALPGDIYLRLSEQKYLKLFRKGDVLEPEDVEKYWKKKQVEYFHIRRGELQEFLRNFNAEVEALIANPSTNPASLRDLSRDIHETVQGIVQVLGVTDEVRDMTRQNMNLMLKVVGQQPSLNSVFDRIQKEKGKYIVSHSLLTAEIACVFAANVAWASDLTFQKLTLAALFHDITLQNHELARATAFNEVRDNPRLLVLETLEDYKLHPYRASRLVLQLNQTPPDVDTIILQHHENPDGSGFPHGISSAKFSPLSALFIIAHDFVDWALAAGAPLQLKDFFDRYRNRHDNGNFRKIFASLEERSRTLGDKVGPS